MKQLTFEVPISLSRIELALILKNLEDEPLQLNTDSTKAKVRAMRMLGVPYTPAEADSAVTDLEEQARAIAADLVQQGGASGADDKEIVALIAYLQRLGTDIKKAPVALREAR